MAQNVTIAGNQYPSVPSILIPKTGGGGNAIFADPSVVTAVAADVASGKYFLDSSGVLTQGTASGGGSPVIQSLSVTQNGTYTAPTGVDGYSPVTVSVSGGGSSAWTKVAETSYQISTTSTTATDFATWETGHSELWTSDKWVYVRIRDTVGKRNGYFYGTDAFMTNVYPVNSGSTTLLSGSILYGTLRVAANNGEYGFRYGTSAGAYGVYAGNLYPNGNITIRTRYSSNYTLTINGTYSVEVYLLDPPTGAPIFT